MYTITSGGEIPFHAAHSDSVTHRRAGQRRNSRHPPAKKPPRRWTAQQSCTARQRDHPASLCDYRKTRRGREEGRTPHRARPMTGLLLFTWVNLVLLNTITPVYDFVSFHPEYRFRSTLY
uniref:Uncharacterized protein n=1 Tax=Oryza meridionalis TaxID=40149 RepID=A0A0E0F2A5_9ORYZ